VFALAWLQRFQLIWAIKLGLFRVGYVRVGVVATVAPSGAISARARRQTGGQQMAL